MNTKFEVVTSPIKFSAHLLKFRKVLWIGALSFEARSTASLSQIISTGTPTITHITVLDYATNILPKDKGEMKREINWIRFQDLSAQLRSVEMHRKVVSAHIYQSLEDQLTKELSDQSLDAAVIDISCLTKIHTLATAYALAKFKRRIPWYIAYTTPENYGFVADPNHEIPSWQDIIIAPFAETAHLFNEASGRGIILPGHESDRLRVALAEIEPAGGLIIMAESKGRPDLRLISERKNQKTIQQLERKRSSKWVKFTIPIWDFVSLAKRVSQEISLAKQHDAPVILFPYGPKSLVFAVTYQLTQEYPESAWFVYPIPSSYDAFYSFGVQETIWIIPQGT